MNGRATGLLGAALVTVALLEGGARLGAAAGWLPTAQPLRTTGVYWRGDHPTFGVWRNPNATYPHRSACFEATYHSNGVGARDRERDERADGRRVVVLGDSFFEGWGLPDAERLSDRLEAATGAEHLNFAMAHFGPYQSLLVYRDLARRYEHDAVIVSVVPANDFGDVDLELARDLDGYQYRYRPYLVAADGEYRHVDHREPVLRRTLRRHSYLFNALAGLRGGGVHEVRMPGAPSRAPSWFYDYGEPQAKLLERILASLAAEAEGRPVAVVLVPTAGDLARHALAGQDPLSRRLEAAGRDAGYRVVNLLPVFAAAGGDTRRAFFSCDYHWSAVGNEIAARALRSSLGAAMYGE